MINFFIDRPIFAWVIAIVIMLAGALAIPSLPVAQYPAIAPPQVAISATYPGASAETLREHGRPGHRAAAQRARPPALLHVRQQQGRQHGDHAHLRAGHRPRHRAGAGPEQARRWPRPSCRMEVQQQGIRVAKGTANFLMIVAFVSSDGSMDREDIADYVASNVQDPTQPRPRAWANYRLFGSQYAMRIWLDPDKLDSYALTPADVNNAVRRQNAQVSAGQFGGLPAVPGQQLNATIIGATRLQTTEQFEDILLRVNRDGSQVRLGDVARIELGQRVSRGSTPSTTASRRPPSASGSPPAPTPSTRRTPCRRRIESLRPLFPAGPGGRLPVRHDAVRAPLDRGGRADADRGDRARVPGDVPVPAELRAPRSSRRSPCRSCCWARSACSPPPATDQHAHHVRPRAGHRPAGRRRHRGGRERRARDGRGGALAEGGHAQVDGRRSPARWSASRMVLAAVFVPMAFFGGSVGVIYRQFSHHPRLGHGALGARRPDPHARALRHDPEARPKGHHEAKRGFFGWFNRASSASAQRYGAVVGGCSDAGPLPADLRRHRWPCSACSSCACPRASCPTRTRASSSRRSGLPPGATQSRRRTRWRRCATTCSPRRRTASTPSDDRRLQLRRPRPELGHRRSSS